MVALPSAPSLNPRVSMLLCLLLLMLSVFLSPSAYAQGGGLNDNAFDRGYNFENPNEADTVTTSGLGSINTDENFSCQNGIPIGDLFVNEQCQLTGGLGIFANVICRVENLFGNILALVYCSVQQALVPPFIALLVLYVVIYGVMVLLGMVRATIREALIRVIKIALVGAIILQADIAINVAYKFYIHFAQSAVGMVFNVFDTDETAISPIVEEPNYRQSAEAGYVLSPIYADPNRRLYTGEHWMYGLDSVVNQAMSAFINGGVWLIIGVFLMAIFMFPVLALMIYLILQLFKAIATAVIGYLLGLLGITFLFAVSPIFVSFALFKTTQGWFEAWLRFLASFTIQIMIIFVFLMLMMMVDIFTFFSQVGTLMARYTYTWNIGPIHMHPLTIPTLCHVQREGEDPHGNNPDGQIKFFTFRLDEPSDDGSHLSDVWQNANGPNTQYEGFPKCIPEYDLVGIINGTETQYLPPNLTLDHIADIRNALSDEEIKAFFENDSSAPEIEIVADIVQEANNDLAYSFSSLTRETDLFAFLLLRLIVVIILTFLLERFLKRVPHMAGYLSGTQHQGRLTGENVDDHSFGIYDSRNFMGIDSAYTTFRSASLGQRKWMVTPVGLVRGVAAGLNTGARATGMRIYRNASGLGNASSGELIQSQAIREQKQSGLWGDEHHLSQKQLEERRKAEEKLKKRRYGGGLEQDARKKARNNKKARRRLAGGNSPSPQAGTAKPNSPQNPSPNSGKRKRMGF